MEHMLEGYMFRLWDGSIWMVKGTVFPRPRAVRGFPRRVGTLKCSSLSCSYRIVREIYPWLLEYDPCSDTMNPIIEHHHVSEIYDPFAKAPDPLTEKLRKILEAETGVEVGVTGSSRFSETPGDIDLVVYGERESEAVYELLGALRNSGILKPLTGKGLLREYAKNIHDTIFSLSTYMFLVKDKLLTGMFEGKPYSIRLVADRRPRYGCKRVMKLGWVELPIRIIDSSRSFLTPATYKIEALSGMGPPLCRPKYMVTYRIRFMEMPKGMKAIVRAQLEYIPGIGYTLIPDHPGGMVLLLGRKR